jgi:uncharacterized protein
MTRPQPRFPEPDTEPFWNATRGQRLSYQVDLDSGDVVFYPRQHNPKTGGRNLEWRESRGLGTVYSYSIVRSNRAPGFKELGSYAVVFVDFDEGFRLLTNVTGVADPTTDVHIGQRVELAWEPQESGIALPLVKPVEPGPS